MCRWCKPDTFILCVKDGVVLSHENITQNPKRPGRDGNIKGHYAQKANITIWDKIVTGCKTERRMVTFGTPREQVFVLPVCVTIDNEVQIRQGVVAIDEVLSRNELFRAELLGDLRHFISRSRENLQVTEGT